MGGISRYRTDFRGPVSFPVPRTKRVADESRGIKPNGPDENAVPYSSPAIKLDDGSKITYVMDSRKIAASLEALSPTPSLHLDADILPRVEEQVNNIMMPLRTVWMAKIPRVILSPSSAEYFGRTRAERVGMPLDEFEKKGAQESEKWWGLAGIGIGNMASILKENGGPFFLGSTGLSALSAS
jgi:hypothetical protein